MRDIIERKYSVLEIDSINRLADENPEQLVKQSEEYYNEQVMRAAQTIKEGMGRCKFVLLCGPSASGKTTTAHKLKHRLTSIGAGARVLSMDNFYRGMVNYPKLSDGSPDMESFSTLDIDLLNSCFEELVKNGNSSFPIFDFSLQEQKLRAHQIDLGANDVLIMEGIHALNPHVLECIPSENIFRIYVSVRTKFVEGEDTVLVPKDIRLLRRMVRDSKFRNYPPIHTLRYWNHVVESEKTNIDLYRDDVNLKMDNTIDYEVCVWNYILGTVLESVDQAFFDEYPQLGKIYTALGRFGNVGYGLIPKNSLLREFIGE